MTFKEFLTWSQIHSDFVKEEDKDKLTNLLKMAHKAGFNNAKNKVKELLKKR